MPWPDQQLGPGETAETALLRRVKFHEFMMTGGQPNGFKNGKLTYSDPVDPSVTPNCPWHNADGLGEPCTAWAEVVAGRVTGYKPEPTLKERQENWDQPKLPKPSGKQHESHGPMVSKTTGKPIFTWDDDGGSEPPLEDARDTAIGALAGEPVPDEIVIDGDEEDED